MTMFRVVTSIDLRFCESESQVIALLAIPSLLYHSAAAYPVSPSGSPDLTLPTLGWKPATNVHGDLFMLNTAANDKLTEAFRKASLLHLETAPAPPPLSQCSHRT